MGPYCGFGAGPLVGAAAPPIGALHGPPESFRDRAARLSGWPTSLPEPPVVAISGAPLSEAPAPAAAPVEVAPAEAAG